MRRYIRGHAISIPALRMERDVVIHITMDCIDVISIHALRMERDLVATGIDAVLITISIHALRMERDRYGSQIAVSYFISIHALRMERDSIFKPPFAALNNFYPRAPHGARLAREQTHRRLYRNFYPRAPHGARHFLEHLPIGEFSFLSTRSAWSATQNCPAVQI